jgi:hypothetical protein
MEAKHSDDQLGRARVQSTPELEAYYNELEQLGAGALWTVANDIEPWEPRSTSVPMLWKYEDLRSLVLKSSELIVGHNINFDINIVGCEFIRNGYMNPFENLKKICTMESTTNYCAIDGPYGYKWPKLSELHQCLFGYVPDGLHDSMVDVEVCLKCYLQLLKVKTSTYLG